MARKRRRTTSPVRAKNRSKTVPVLKSLVREHHIDALLAAIERNQTPNAIRRARSARSFKALVNVANKTSLLEALELTESPAPAVSTRPDFPNLQSTSASQRFQLQQKIGQGNFGSVWKAVDRQDGRTYALKILPRMDSESEREVALLKRFSADSASCHRNVICYQDMFVMDVAGKWQFVIQMEFIDGVSLSEWKEWWFENNKFRPSDYIARKLATDLFAAVDAIHRQRVYHLDIKPSNVMLRNQGRDAVLIDFGLSCTAKATRTKPDTCFNTDGNGTIHYMSPDYLEYCTFSESRDSKCNEETRRYTDIWATGLTLWCVLQKENVVRNLFDRFDKKGYDEKFLPAFLRNESKVWQRSVLYPLGSDVDEAIRLALNEKESKKTTAAKLLKIVQ